MGWPDKLKLNKQLLKAVADEGYDQPKEIQLKTLARINGGQDVITIGPGGCGKTTTYVLAVLNLLRYNTEGVPRVLILVPDKDHVEAVIDLFDRLNRNRSLLIVGLYPAPGIESQMNALADGADIVIATPDRARAIYLKLGLNLNKIELLIIDDAELIVKQGLQLPVAELANSIVKAQRLVFTGVMHDKLHKMIDPFMKLPATIEVEEIKGADLKTLPQVIYHVPNFGTKLNLLNLFVQDEDLFTKIVVFVNTRQTAEKIYKSLQNRLKAVAAIYKPWFFEDKGFSDFADFKSQPDARVLIVVNNVGDKLDLSFIPFLIHFELPAEKETLINRVLEDGSSRSETEDEALSLIFATDLELSEVKKIEQAISRKISVGELPEQLVIEKEKKKTDTDGKTASTKKADEPPVGQAMHEKKPGNAKNFNYSAGQKARMNNKRKHG